MEVKKLRNSYTRYSHWLQDLVNYSMKYNLQTLKKTDRIKSRKSYYYGLLTSKMIPGQVIEGRHEPLISKELFLSVHNIRQEKRSHGFVHEKDNDNLSLKIFTRCDKCNQALTGYLVKKKGLYYYKCSTKGCKVNRSAKAMHNLFQGLLKSFQIDAEKFEIIRFQLEEQMNVFFESSLKDTKI